MKLAAVLLSLTAASACAGPDDSDMLTPDAAVAQPDAPNEPKPAFSASTMISGKLAIDDTGIRETYKRQGDVKPSVVSVGLTETATTKNCGVTLAPKLVQFGSASTSTRQFKTVVLDFANSKIVEDTCGWDDAWILSQLDQQFGHYIVGFAKARFAEDQPYLDVYYDAVQPFPNSTANIVSTGSGSAYGMNADGSITLTMVEPTPGTLLPALYSF
ncbi:MAG TPA: hypothetical protein VM692_14670 [Gammaproteobacteria bacterium]|nr:hypothetical protein [Gammaproteobacteria bacterium]